MKKLLYLTLLASLAISCGTDEEDSDTSSYTPWTQPQLTGSINSCKQNYIASEGEPAIPQMLESFCSCITHAVADRWSYADYSANTASINHQLDESGISYQCVDKAEQEAEEYAQSQGWGN